MGTVTTRTVRTCVYLLAAVTAFVLMPASSHGQGGKKVTGTVGPGFTISLRTAAGAKVGTLQPGIYAIVVRDRSAVHNFHLRGPGVNKKTGVAFKGSVTWKPRLTRGKVYTYFCDVHPTLNGKLNVARGAGSPAPPPPTTTPPPTYDPYP